MTLRLTFLHVLMCHAELAAQRSTCPAARVGAALARGSALLGTAYNGAPSGARHCDEAGCVVIPARLKPWTDNHLMYAVDEVLPHTREYSRHAHAEAALIAHCARLGIACEGAEVYVTRAPCLDCVKLLATAGIAAVVCREAAWLAAPSTVLAFMDECGLIRSTVHDEAGAAEPTVR